MKKHLRAGRSLSIEPLEERSLLSATVADFSGLLGPQDIERAGPAGLGVAEGDFSFDNGGCRFVSTGHYDSLYDYYHWDGWAYSNKTDVTTPGYGNQFSAFVDSPDGDNAYGVGYATWAGKPVIELTEESVGCSFESVMITNTTYAALSMQEGDWVAKKFGGESGDDADWFLLTIEGFDNDGQSVGTVPFYLADYRFEDNAQDYIVNEWTTVDLTSLVGAQSLEFSLTSSDLGDWGMNTPSYFAADNLVLSHTSDPVLTVEGTTDADVITVDAAAGTVSVGDAVTAFDPAVITTLDIRGLGGGDSLILLGTDQDDTLAIGDEAIVLGGVTILDDGITALTADLRQGDDVYQVGRSATAVELRDGDAASTVDLSGLDAGVTLRLGTTRPQAIGDGVTLTLRGAFTHVIGTEFADRFYGSRGDDHIEGRGGDDLLSGSFGNDRLLGGDGNDRLSGSHGDDVLDGGEGDDRLDGSFGDDTLLGGGGNDTIYGSVGDDVLVGGDGNDRLYGRSGRNVLIGGQGADRIYGSSGDDLLVDGATKSDDNAENLQQILMAWTAEESLAQRQQMLRNGLLADDQLESDLEAIDRIYGMRGDDWILMID